MKFTYGIHAARIHRIRGPLDVEFLNTEGCDLGVQFL